MRFVDEKEAVAPSVRVGYDVSALLCWEAGMKATRVKRAVSILNIVCGGSSYWCASEMGKQVGNDEGGSADEDDVGLRCIGLRCCIGRYDGVIGTAVKIMGTGLPGYGVGRERAPHAGVTEVVDSMGGEQGEDGGDVFVARHAENHTERASAGEVAKLGDDILPTANIVAGVADGEGGSGDGLPASAKSSEGADFGKAAADVGDGEGEVVLREESGKGGGDGLPVALLAVAAEAGDDCAKGCGVGVFSKDDGSTDLGGFSQEYRARLRSGLADDDGDSRLDDACLLGSDLLEGAAEEADVVKRDVGDDAEIGEYDVGTVEASAQPHFDDGYVDLLIGEVAEGHGGCEFEEGGMEGLEKGAVLSYKIDDILLADHLSIDADAFAKVDEVG